TSVEEGQDDQREGRVVAFETATWGLVGVTALGPQDNTGFNANGRLAPADGLTPAVAQSNPPNFGMTPTGAYPNQLASVALHPYFGWAYVVSTAASPNGPIRFNVMNPGLVSVLDTVSYAEVTAGQTDPAFRRTAPLNLNQGVNLNTGLQPRLFLTNPVAMAWRPDGSDAWVVVQNTDVVARLTID